MIPASTLSTPCHRDDRGYFAESWNDSWQTPFDMRVRQTNVCWTEHANTLRGFHAQWGPAEVAKLIRVIKGEILDVYVDARLHSPDYGVFQARRLTNISEALYVPRGFYHGYVTLTDDALVTYHQDAVYDGNHECGLNFAEAGELFWNSWLIDTSKLIISDKDRAQPKWSSARKFSL